MAPLADPTAPPGAKRGRLLVVDPEIQSRETKLTILLGVLLANDSAKAMTRWTMWNPPQPFFGLHTAPEASVVIEVTSGIAMFAVAFLLLQMRRTGWWLALLAVVAQLVSVVASWNMWDGYVAEMTTRRREFQGLTVRPGEIEFMQSMTPEVLVAWLVVLAIPLIALRRRYSR